MADPESTRVVAHAVAVYRSLLERHHRTLDLLSPKAFADLDRLLVEAERYATCVMELAPEGGVLDLGSGAGLPGVIVAAHLHPRPMWWVERRQRRATFLEQVAAFAGLTGVRVIADDVRALPRPEGGVRAITAQAVASFTDVARLTRHLWADSVVLISRKGPEWPAEVDALAAWWAVERSSQGAGRGSFSRRQGVRRRADSQQGDRQGGSAGAAFIAATDAQGGSADASSRPVFVSVRRTEPLGTRGTLVAVDVRGG